MAAQFSVASRNAQLDAHETATGASARLRLLTGAKPANCAAAQTGAQVAEMNLPADWMAAASGGTKGLLGTWQVAAAAAGAPVTYYRITDSTGATCHEQGDVFQQVQLNTNALTAVNGNVLNFAATTGVVVGMNASGTGVPAGASVVAVGATTVTLSMTSTAGVANAAAITFNGDITLDNTTINPGQTITITAKTLTAGNA
jgi:hypothetical protein